MLTPTKRWVYITLIVARWYSYLKNKGESERKYQSERRMAVRTAQEEILASGAHGNEVTSTSTLDCAGFAYPGVTRLQANVAIKN